jgi:hypothetical protein
VAPAYLYLAYLLLDQFLIPQGRLVKWVRNASAFFFVLLYCRMAVLPALGMPVIPAERALLAVMCGAGFAYLYERGRVAVGFVRGVVLTVCLELAALHLAPTPIGPHVALPLFAAAYAWERGTVFWRYAVPALLLYVVLIARWLLGGMDLLPHMVVGLVAAFLARLFPERGAVAEEAEQEAPSTTTLGFALGPARVPGDLVAHAAGADSNRAPRRQPQVADVLQDAVVVGAVGQLDGLVGEGRAQSMRERRFWVTSLWVVSRSQRPRCPMASTAFAVTVTRFTSWARMPVPAKRLTTLPETTQARGTEAVSPRHTIPSASAVGPEMGPRPNDLVAADGDRGGAQAEDAPEVAFHAVGRHVARGLRAEHDAGLRHPEWPKTRFWTTDTPLTPSITMPWSLFLTRFWATVAADALLPRPRCT